MGRVTDQSAASSVAIYSTLEAGEAIKSGDLIVQATDGRAYWATDPAVPASGSRPIYQAADIYLAQPNTTINVIGNGLSNYEATSLSLAYFDDGSFLLANTLNDAGFTIFKPDGSVSVPRVVLSNTSTSISIATKKLPNGNAIVLYVGANGRMSFVIVSPKGEIIKTQTQLDTVSVYSMQITVLPNGSTAVVYCHSASSYGHKYLVIGLDGSIIKSPVVLVTGYSSTSGMPNGIAAASDNTFAVAWCGSGGAWIQICSPIGEAVGSAQQISSATASQQRIKIVPLANGGYGVGYCPDISAAGYGLLYVFSASGARLKDPYTMTGLATQSVAYHAFDVCPMSDGGMAAVWIWNENNTSYIGVARISGSGSAVIVPSKSSWLPSPYPSANNQVFRIAQAIDGSGNILLSWYGNSQTMITQFDGAFNHLRTLQSVFINMGASYGAGFIDQIPDPLNSNAVILMITSYPTGALVPLYQTQMLLYVRGRIPVGVATADTAKGARVKFMTQGSMPTRLTFFKPFNADYNAGFGQKLALVGNMAVLKGIQP